MKNKKLKIEIEEWKLARVKEFGRNYTKFWMLLM